MVNSAWAKNVSFVLFCLFLMGTALAAEEGGLPVSFSVEETGGINRPAAAITGGISFAKGSLDESELQHLRLLDESGSSKPFACTVTARWSWPDGSIRWLLLDFQADVSANQTRTFTLVKNPDRPKPSPPDSLTIDQTDETISVDTGPLSFDVSRNQFAPFLNLKRGEQPSLASSMDMIVDLLQAVPEERDEENWLRNAPEGETIRLSASSGTVHNVEVEVRNPFRSVIKLMGEHKPVEGSPANTDARFPYTLRVTVYAGKPEVRVRHTLLYDANNNRETIRRVGLRFPLTGRGTTTAAVGGQGPDPLKVEPEAPERKQSGQPHIKKTLNKHETLSLLSTGPPKRYHNRPRYDMSRINYRVDALDGEGTVTEKLDTGDSPRGWIAAAGKSGSMTLAIRNFWRKHPKELSVETPSRTLTAWLWPDRGEKVLDLRRYDEKMYYGRRNPDEGKRYESENMEAGRPYGLGLSHELQLSFDDAPVSPDRGEALTTKINDPLYVLCDPEHYASTGVLGPVAPYDPDTFPRLEGAQDVLMEWILRNRRDYGWYGLLDYGDVLMEFNWLHMRKWTDQPKKRWLCRGYSGWLQNDGQLGHTFFLQALRRGSPRLLSFAESVTRHTAEVDVPHLEIPGTDGDTVMNLNDRTRDRLNVDRLMRQMSNITAEKGINDNYGRPRIGGVHRHNQHHFGDYIYSRGTPTHETVLLYNLTGDRRMLDIARQVALQHVLSWNYTASDSLGLARLYHTLGDPALLDRSRQLRDSFLEFKKNFVFFNNKLPTFWFYFRATGDPKMKNFFTTHADKGPYLDSYNNGLLETFAYRATGNEKYRSVLPKYFKRVQYNKNFALSDLRKPPLSNGARELGFTELWNRVERFQPITPEKLYHINGHILSKWPYVMSLLEDESFLD